MTQEHKGKKLDKVKGFEIIDCKICGFKHAMPIPNEQELNKMYREWFYKERKPEYFKNQKKENKWWKMIYEERLRRLEGYMKPGVKEVLDVGCGPGFFMKSIRHKGWKAVGIEPSPQAAKYARKMKLPVINDFFKENIIKRLRKFDVVHMQGVLEHLSDPKKMLKICYKALKPNGLLFLVVGNDYNPLQRILREQFDFKPWWVIPPEHLNYFDIKSLKKFVNNNKFEVVDTITTFPIELFLIMGDNYIGNEEVGRKCHRKREKFEFAIINSRMPKLKEELYRFFTSKGIGRSIELIARKLN